jgi:hypothetical protein
LKKKEDSVFLCVDNETNSDKNIYKIKLKTVNKEFRDKNTKLQIELIGENQQSEVITHDQTENNLETLQKGKIDTFTIDSTKDLGKVCHSLFCFV